MYLIINGQIVTENAILQNHDLLVADDRIEGIKPHGEISAEGAQVIDARGGFVTPGFIDIHSDYIETMAAPRPTCLMDFQVSLRETEKILLNQGITTMFHSLSLYQSEEFDHKPIRNRENAQKLVEIIHRTHESQHLIRHRFHARLEIDSVDQVEDLVTYMNEDKVHLLSFMDHTPGQGQYGDLVLYRKILRGYKDLNDHELDRLIDEKLNKEKLTLEKIHQIAALALKKEIAIASHDDDSAEKLEIAKAFGTQISEFPITLAVAEKAKELGLFTLAGAPNILLGGSHTGNLSAAEGVQKKVIDILCSDYYPAALLHAVFILHEKYRLPLVDMFKLVTLHPARAVNLDHMIGSIEIGKKADLLIIEKICPDFPTVTSVLVDGKLMSTIHYRG